MRSYQDIKREIRELEQLAEQLLEDEKRDARHRIFAILRDAGMTPEMLLDLTEKPERKKMGEVPVKYRNSAGETWTGRGRMPKWLKAEAEPEKFRVDAVPA